MAYSLETSSVKTIVPGAEVSGFCDVVARQKINEVSGEVPQLSAGEGIDISTVNGKTVITNNISAGSNISLVYDMETNTYRIDGQAGVDPASAVFSESARMPTLGLSYFSGVKISGGDETLYHKTIAAINTYISAVSLNGPYVTYLTGDSDVPTDLHPVTSEHWNNIITATKEVSDNSWNWNNTFNTVTANSASWGQGGGANYSGVSPIVVDNNEQIISADVWEFSAGNGLKFTDDNVNKMTKLEVDGNDLYSGEGIIISSNDNNQTRILLDQEWLNNQVNLSNYYKKTETSSKTELTNAFNNLNIDGLNMSASTNIDMFESGGYIIISANGGNAFPITGTNGTTGFTANMDCSSMMLTTGASPAGGYVKQTVHGVQYEAYPATDVSASWYNIINAANNINVTCSAVKLTTAASEHWFYTSALPNLNEITFIAPSYGPYQTYSALIDDGDTTFVAEVDSGCCVKVVRNWNDDRNKNCWCGLNQETYFYIG